MNSPVSFARHLLDFWPDPVQAMILASIALRGLINCSRQWGKSTIMAVKALYEAMCFPGTLVLVLCPTFRQAGEFFENVRKFMVKLGIRPTGDGHNEVVVRLPNESRIIGLSGEGEIRSYRGVSLLLIDEAAEVPDYAYQVVRPTLSTFGKFGGTIWMMSTPQGREGFFWNAWANEGNRWKRFSVPATDCPRISRTFLDEERDMLGPRLFAQEYMCEFVEPPDSLLNREDIYASLRPEVPLVWQ